MLLPQEDDGLELGGVDDLAGPAGDSTLFSQGLEEETKEGREGDLELSDAGALPVHKWHPHTVKVRDEYYTTLFCSTKGYTSRLIAGSKRCGTDRQSDSILAAGRDSACARIRLYLCSVSRLTVACVWEQCTNNNKRALFICSGQVFLG